MRKSTGARTVQTTTFVHYLTGLETAIHTWTPAEKSDLEIHLESYESVHLSLNEDEHGNALDVQVWEYERPGLHVYAYVTDGTVELVISVSDDDASRLHKAVRKQQPVTVSYVKADGEETVRTIEPTGLQLTKSGDVIVKALDRKSDEHRSFRLDRVLAYTVHRTRFLVRTPAPAPSKAELVRAFQAPEHIKVVTDIYSTEPGTAAALQAPEDIQDRIAERYALGHRFAFVTL